MKNDTHWGIYKKGWLIIAILFLVRWQRNILSRKFSLLIIDIAIGLIEVRSILSYDTWSYSWIIEISLWLISSCFMPTFRLGTAYTYLPLWTVRGEMGTFVNSVGNSIHSLNFLNQSSLLCSVGQRLWAYIKCDFYVVCND